MLDYNLHHAVKRASKSVALLTYIQKSALLQYLGMRPIGAQSLRSVVTYMHACVTNIAIIRHKRPVQLLSPDTRSSNEPFEALHQRQVRERTISAFASSR
jgi:hypothetical protein